MDQKTRTGLVTLVTQSPSGTHTSCARDRMTNRLSETGQTDSFCSKIDLNCFGRHQRDSQRILLPGLDKVLPRSSCHFVPPVLGNKPILVFQSRQSHCDMTRMLSSLLDLARIRILNLCNAGNAPLEALKRARTSRLSTNHV